MQALNGPVYGIFTVNSPAVTNVITPPHVHIRVLILSSDGALSSNTGGDTAPGIHGAGVTGMHGIGVRTPNAAAVAAATAGFVGVMHIPNGGMFTIGT